MKKFIWFWLSGLALFSGVARAESPLQEKIGLERHIAQEVGSILDRFVGPGRSHVTVFLTVDAKPLENGQGAAAGNKEGLKDALNPKIQSKWMWKEISRKPKLAILPGFAVSPELSVTEDREKKSKRSEPELVDEPAAGPASMLEVKRMLVSVVLDSSLADKNAKMVEVMVSEVLGLDPERGDRLNIYKLPLQPAWTSLKTPENISSLFWIFTGLLSLAASLWLFSGLAQRVMKAFGLLPSRKKQAESAKKDSSGGEDAAALEKPLPSPVPGREESGEALILAPGGAVVHAKPALDFITPENVGILAELVQGSDCREIACLVGFLEPGLASSILEQLPQEKRLKTMIHLAQVAFVEPKLLEEMKDAWRERLAYAYGGTDAVGELLSTAEPKVQSSILDSLKSQSPELARKVDSAMFRFEDIFSRRDDDLAQIVQSVPFEELARAMVGFPEEGKKRLLTVLPEASQEAMRQWMSFTTAPQAQVTQARMRLLQAARALRRQGKIQFSKAPAPAAATGMPRVGDKVL